MSDFTADDARALSDAAPQKTPAEVVHELKKLVEATAKRVRRSSEWTVRVGDMPPEQIDEVVESLARSGFMGAWRQGSPGHILFDINW